MTYTLRIYSRDNEGISSAVTTFMTSAGERGPAWPSPASMGMSCSSSASRLSLLPGRRTRPPLPHLAWRGSALLMCQSAAAGKTEGAKGACPQRGNCVSDPVGMRGHQGETEAVQPEDGGAPWPPLRCVHEGSVSANMVCGGRSGGSAARPHTGSLPACGGRGQDQVFTPESSQEPNRGSACMALPCHLNTQPLFKNSKVCYPNCLQLCFSFTCPRFIVASK